MTVVAPIEAAMLLEGVVVAVVAGAEVVTVGEGVDRRLRKAVRRSKLAPVTFETRKTGHIRSEVKLVALQTTSSLGREMKGEV